MKKLMTLIAIFLITGLLSADYESKPLPAWKTKNIERLFNDYRFIPFLTPPPTGKIYTPAEFAPIEGVIIQVPTSSVDVNNYYAEMIKAIISADATPYIIADSTNGYLGYTINDIKKITDNVLTPNNISKDDVVFLDYDYDANWTRDFGPWDIYLDGERAIIDHQYYDDRPRDNAINGKLSTLWNEKIFSTGLYTEGGNFMTDGLGTCWASTGVIEENTTYYGWKALDIEKVYLDYLNCHNGIYHPEPLPDEGTTHIDMFSKILDQNTIIVSFSTPELGASSAEIAALDAAANFYASTPKPDGGEWNIIRIPMTFGNYSSYGDTWRVQYTHTNSTIVNDHVIMPVYGRGTDEEAIKIYKQLMPRHKIIGIDSNKMIVWGGSIHCTTMQLPLKTYSKCGNGVVEDDEECDTHFTNGIECNDIAEFNSGVILCDNNCRFDTSLCSSNEESDENNEKSDDESHNDNYSEEPSDDADSYSDGSNETNDFSSNNDKENEALNDDFSFSDDTPVDSVKTKHGGCSFLSIF